VPFSHKRWRRARHSVHSVR